MSTEEESYEGSEDNKDEKLDNDELSAEEEGFMRGYEEESESEDEFGIDSDPDEE